MLMLKVLYWKTTSRWNDKLHAIPTCIVGYVSYTSHNWRAWTWYVAHPLLYGRHTPSLDRNIWDTISCNKRCPIMSYEPWFSYKWPLRTTTATTPEMWTNSPVSNKSLWATFVSILGGTFQDSLHSGRIANDLKWCQADIGNPIFFKASDQLNVGRVHLSAIELLISAIASDDGLVVLHHFHMHRVFSMFLIFVYHQIWPEIVPRIWGRPCQSSEL